MTKSGADPESVMPRRLGKLIHLGMLRTLPVTLILCLSCASSGDGVVYIDVRSDFVGGIEVGQVTVLGEMGPMLGLTSTVSVDGSTPLLRGFRAARFDGLSAGNLAITARLLSPDGTLVAERRAVATVREDSVFTVVFTRSCQSVSCPTTGATECVSGACVPPECSPENLEACGPSVCSSSSECPASATPCASALCEAGACFQRPVEGACARGESCVPDRGCVPQPDPNDAGAPIDAGAPVDSGASPDARLSDRDDDGVPDDADNCPDDANATQHDEDADSIGDVCDRCPHIPDSAQPDSDSDGVGDACDPDPATGGNRIVSFLSFGDGELPDGWTAEVEAGAPWIVEGDDLVVAVSDDDVARFTTTPTPNGAETVVETEFTVDAIAPYVSGYQFRTVAIIDDTAGPPESDDATFTGIIHDAQLLDARLEVLVLRNGRGSRSSRSDLDGPLPTGQRFALRYSRDGMQRTGTLAGPTTRTATLEIPVVGGGIGVRVRGLSVRFHHIIVIR